MSQKQEQLRFILNNRYDNNENNLNELEYLKNKYTQPTVKLYDPNENQHLKPSYPNTKIIPSGINHKNKKSKTLTKQKHTDYSYISPYILLAEKRANDRIQQRKQLVRNKNKETIEWNQNTSTNTLFDPTIKKQDIFKIQPKIIEKSIKSITNVDHESSMNNTTTPLAENKQRLTIKTTGSSPMLAVNRRLVDGSTSPIHNNYYPGSNNNNNNNSNSNNTNINQTIPFHAGSRNIHSSPNTSLEYDRSQPRHGSPTHYVSPTSNSYERNNNNNSSSSKNNVLLSRSTSPMKEHEIKHILQKDAIIYDDYTSTIPPYHPQNNDLLLFDNDAIKDEKYYTSILRHRLREILLTNDSEDSDDSENDNKEDETDQELYTSTEERKLSNKYHKKSMKQNKKKSTSTATTTTNDNHKSVQQMEVLMSSIAQIMSAVGNIVTNNQNITIQKLKQHKNKKYIYPQQAVVQQLPVQLHITNPNPSYIYDLAGNINEMKNHHKSSNRKDLIYSATTTNSLIATQAHDNNNVNSGNESNTQLHQIIPRSKSDMLDMILAKLQNIEQTEYEIQHYLSNPSTNATHNITHNENIALEQSNEVIKNMYTTNTSDDIPFVITHNPTGIIQYDNSISKHNHIMNKHINTSINISNNKHMINPSSTTNHYIRDEFLSMKNISNTPHVLYTHENAISNWLDKVTYGGNLNNNDNNNIDIISTSANLHLASNQVTMPSKTMPAYDDLKLLSLLGASTKLSRTRIQNNENHQKIIENNISYLKIFPKLNKDINSQDILTYMSLLNQEREYKDVAFHSRGVSMSEVADKVTDELLYQLIGSISIELDQYFTEYSEKFVNKI